MNILIYFEFNLVWFVVFNATFNKFQLYRGAQFYWWVNQSTGVKPPTCHKALTIFITMLYRVHLAISGIQTHNVVVIGTDCTGSCKSNYHMITATMALNWIELSIALVQAVSSNLCGKKEENKWTKKLHTKNTHHETYILIYLTYCVQFVIS